MKESLKKHDDVGITFSFGANWQDYLRTVSEASIQSARDDIEKWLGSTFLTNKTVLDIGCGSGVHSLVFSRMGARRIFSMDVDPLAVEATRTLWHREGEPQRWEIVEGSILDEAFLSTLGVFDAVYAWGVLHHTGALWKALDNTSRLVAPGGRLWIALYADGPNYDRDLCIKKTYNASSGFGKRVMVYRWIGRLMWGRFRRGQNPFGWNQKKERGMNVYHDIIDWLGGLPYEVAHPDRVTEYLCELGFVPSRIELFPEGCNHIYLFTRNKGDGDL
ncbi:MAG TPA: class I SAM-dependent methyltransferase [Syntrophales bacterium]|nr:class I SAM-dependent methyltransferase [Syntrophales bacterium]